MKKLIRIPVILLAVVAAVMLAGCSVLQTGKYSPETKAPYTGTAHPHTAAHHKAHPHKHHAYKGHPHTTAHHKKHPHHTTQLAKKGKGYYKCYTFDSKTKHYYTGTSSVSRKLAQSNAYQKCKDFAGVKRCSVNATKKCLWVSYKHKAKHA